MFLRILLKSIKWLGLKKILLMMKLLKYAQKLAAQRDDETLVSKDEFMASLERGEEEYRQGKCDSLLPDEDLTTYLRRRGYDI